MLDNDQTLKTKTVLLAVSVDPPDKTKRLLAKIEQKPGLTSIEYLEDKDHKVIDRYGILNPKSNPSLPHPATLVIDQNGILRWKFIEVDYKIRPSNAEVLSALKAIK